MKQTIFILLLITGFVANAGSNPKPQDFSIGVSASFGDAAYFNTALTPYGEWLEVDAGFYAWRPRHVRAGWRPYLQGHWSWTRFGWYWVSSEPFGWAVYHYGRWYYDDYYGWIWIPDRTWGPSWVEWRYDNDYIGWAPLPPYASFSIHFGIRFTTRWFAPDRYWSFVRYRHFTDPYLHRVVAPADYVRRLIRTTRSAGKYEYDNGNVINRGVDRSYVQRRGGFRRLEAVDVEEVNTPREQMTRTGGRERIETYRLGTTTRDQSNTRIEARRLDRGTSLDLQRIERTPRDVTRTPAGREPDRERGAVRQETPADRPAQQPAPTTRDEGVRRGERRTDIPNAPPQENRQIERQREQRVPAPQREQVEPRRERSSTPSPRQQREEVKAPRSRNEQARPAPSPRQESPRSTERGKREGGRGRG